MSEAMVPGSVVPRLPTLLRCGLLILAIRVALEVWGFGRVISWIARRVQQVPPSIQPDGDFVSGVERVVATAGALYPGRARCLEQSLVLYYLLRRQGIAARYCQGIMAYPFEAHAWVEYGGEVVNYIGEHAKSFARLPDQLP